MLARRLIPVLTAIAGAALAIPVTVFAQSEVFLCPGANGVPEYKNNGNTKGCRKIVLEESAIIPAPRQPAARPTTGAPAAASSAAAPSTPSAFPRIDTATQRTRDTERRGVLERELRDEETKLAALRREFNNGEPERQGDERNYQKYLDRVAALKEDVVRSEANVAAIRRELSALK